MELATFANARALSTRGTCVAARRGPGTLLGQAPTLTRWLGGVTPAREGMGSTDRWHDGPDVQLLGFVRRACGRSGADIR